MATACRARDEVVEARISVGSAETAMAGDNLPASIAGTPVVYAEDLGADRAEHAKEQVTGGLAYVGIGGMVQHSQYTFGCAGWVGAANVRPNLFPPLDWLLPFCPKCGPS
jgi:hypothetical protein